MNNKKLAHFRKQLEALSARLDGDIATLENQARTPTGGESAGGLSNAPMHLGDLGTEVYLQELNATLLENESYLRGEAVAAMERIENGTYGTCKNCGKKIIEERLELIPYARYCTPCAEKLQAGKVVNLNEGRPRGPDETFSAYDRRVAPEFKGTDYTSREIKGRRPDRDDTALGEGGDIHAAGTAGGGTAEGGLAGTNVGAGDPDNADLEDAMGSGNHDVAIEKDDEDTVPYSGPHGGAVGGTPAGKRAVGGKVRRRGIVPSEDPDLPENPVEILVHYEANKVIGPTD